MRLNDVFGVVESRDTFARDFITLNELRKFLRRFKPLEFIIISSLTIPVMSCTIVLYGEEIWWNGIKSDVMYVDV